MAEPTSDRSYHRAIIAAALISALAVIIAAFIQRAPLSEPAILQATVQKLWSKGPSDLNGASNVPTNSTTVTTETNTIGATTLAEFRALTVRAEAGDRTSQLELADDYYEGHGIARNYSKALYWYQQAAAAGEVRAATQLGWMHTRGIGTPQNREEAARWFRSAAEAGDARAANYLGWAYVQGWGVPVDYPQARFWLEKSAAANDRLGLYNLGLVYERGLGGSPDLTTAITFYKRSASAGYAGAREALRRLGIAE